MVEEINRFVNWVRRRNPEAHTWRDYRSDLQQFVAAVGDRPPEEIGFQDIDEFITEQAARGLKAATINRRLAAVMSLYTFLSDERPGLLCPVLPHRHTLLARRRIPRPAPEADIRRFFAVIESARAIFLLMLRCGLRISEVTRLKLRDLYLVEAPPRMLVSGKNSKERTVYLSDQAASRLRTAAAVELGRLGTPAAQNALWRASERKDEALRRSVPPLRADWRARADPAARPDAAAPPGAARDPAGSAGGHGRPARSHPGR